MWNQKLEIEQSTFNTNRKNVIRIENGDGGGGGGGSI